MRKAQLSAFLLLGFVILAVVSFMMFATADISKQKDVAQAKLIATQIIETTPLKNYVISCASKALEKSIDNISKQAGRLDDYSQGEPFVPWDFSNKTYNVYYGITTGNISSPQFPCKNIVFGDPAFCAFNVFNPNFNNYPIGVLNMPQLCKNAGDCAWYQGGYPKFSVQSQLEDYISKFIDRCVNFSQISQINSSYNVMQGNANTTMTFTDSGVSIVIDLPLIISSKLGQPIVQMAKFQTFYDTRFAVIYGIAKTLAERDVKTPTSADFDLTQQFNDLLNDTYNKTAEQAGISLQRTILPGSCRDLIANSCNDLIEVSDTRTEQDKKLTVAFVRENRPPVLNYLGTGPTTINGCNKQFDIFGLENTVLKINYSAFDTEKDNLTYNITGWLKDYNETFTSVSSDGCNYVGNQKIYKNPTDIRWNMTQDGILSADLSLDDAGPHNLTIKVCETQNPLHCDWQLIRILIDDLLKVNITKSNLYNSDNFSIEDPFNFTAAINGLAGSYNDIRYSWRIMNASNILFKNDSANETFITPEDNYDIYSIKESYKNLLNQIDPDNFVNNLLDVILNVSYTLHSGVSYYSDNITTIMPQECIYHQNDSLPYPYNTTDPFLANHSCCDYNGNYKKDIAICFTNVTYGSSVAFDDNHNINAYATPYDDVLNSVRVNNSYIMKLNASDIYKRTYTRYCSGDRGNICSGEINDSYTSFMPCGVAAPNGMHCSGPNKSSLHVIATSKYTLACINYENNTFENLSGLNNSIICNNTPKCMATNDSLNWSQDQPGQTKRYICNPTCGNGDCNRVIPSLCEDCYQQQSCIGLNKTQDINVSQNQSIIVTLASANCLTASCVKTTTTANDYCAANGNLIKVLCNQTTNQQIINYSVQKNCTIENEKEAFIPVNPINCTSYISVCSQQTNSCSPPISILYNNAPNGKTWTKKSNWGNSSINETCVIG